MNGLPTLYLHEFIPFFSPLLVVVPDSHYKGLTASLSERSGIENTKAFHHLVPRVDKQQLSVRYSSWMEIEVELYLEHAEVFGLFGALFWTKHSLVVRCLKV